MPCKIDELAKIIHRAKKPDTEPHFDSRYVKCGGQEEPQQQKIGWWLPRLLGKEQEVRAHGGSVSSGIRCSGVGYYPYMLIHEKVPKTSKLHTSHGGGASFGSGEAHLNFKITMSEILTFNRPYNV